MRAYAREGCAPEGSDLRKRCVRGEKGWLLRKRSVGWGKRRGLFDARVFQVTKPFPLICNAALFIQSHLWSVDNFENIFLRKNKYVMLMLQSAGTFSFIFALVRYRVKTSHQQRPLERDSAVHACTFAHWYRPESTLPSLCDYKDVGSGGCSGRCP